MRKNDGYVLVTALLALAVMSLLGAAALQWANSSLRLSRQAVQSEQAFYLANAGAEAALALAGSGGNLDGGPLMHTMAIAPGQTGTYTVTLTRQADGAYQAVSVGRFGSAQREVTVRVRPPVAGLKDLPALIITGGPVSLSNHSEVCGDIIAAGDISLGAQSVVWDQDRTQNPASPCTSVRGKGRAISTGKVTLTGQAQVRGGYCDSVVNGTGTPCPTAPTKFAVPDIDLNVLKQQANRWYVRDEGFCRDKPLGRCTAVPAGFVLRAEGRRTYNNELIYVEGTVVVPETALAYRGAVTFAATGGIYLDGNALPDPAGCSQASPCGAAFLTDGPLVVGNKVTAWGIFITESPRGLEWGVDAELHGQIVAPRMESGNHAIFYPDLLPVTPPGAPVFGLGGGGFDGWIQGGQ